MGHSKNLFPHNHYVNSTQRKKLIKQQPLLIWLSGLSGSGKSTIANKLEKKLYENGCLSYLLDGDNIRVGLNNDLGFTDEGRKENIRRIAEVSRLMIDAGLIVITAFISPFDKERKLAKSLVLENNYFLVHVNCSVAKCDEIPKDPNLIVDTEKENINESVDKIFIAIKNNIKD